MYRFIRIAIVLFSCVIYLNGSTYSKNLERYNTAKKHYIFLIGKKDTTSEIKYLKQLIYYGKKLKKNVYKYQKELRRLDKKAILRNPIQTKQRAKTKSNSKYSIRSVTQKDNRVTIIFNKKISKQDIKYFIKRGKNKYQYIFDIKGRFKDASPTVLSMDNVDRIKIFQYRFNTLRIIFMNRYRLKPMYLIGSKKIILKIKPLRKLKIKKKFASLVPNSIKQKTIVIDAGHGGKDVGASAGRRKYEKTVTLSIARKLYFLLKKSGYKVYLTRSRDHFVSLKYRTSFANKKQANMFISIHANSVPKSKRYKVQGVETYFLSPARSDRAKRVAAIENKGDMDNMGWSSQNALLTILNQGKITASNKMAIDIQKNILYLLRKKYGKHNIKDGGVREGPFWVLVGAQMPSVLVEVGYISNPHESKRIFSSSYQKAMAQAIANGVNSYFLKND